MTRFILQRLLQGVLTLLALSIVVFILTRLTGDPTDLLVSPDAPPDAKEAIRHDLGLDQPYYVQYWFFITHAARGDFGQSIQLGRPAMQLVLQRLPNSVELATLAMAFALFASFPLGVAAAVNRGTWIDQSARFIAVIGITMPAFLLGILLIQFFAVQLRWVPAGSLNGPASFILPTFTLGLFAMASLTRLLRSSLIETLDMEYIKLARLKGVSERLVIWKHALRNSVVPVLTLAGVFFSQMITVAVVVETVFNWPGIGTLAYNAITGRDFPVIQAVVIVSATIVIGVNLLIDVSYAFVDPRIRAT